MTPKARGAGALSPALAERVSWHLALRGLMTVGPLVSRAIPTRPGRLYRELARGSKGAARGRDLGQGASMG